MAFNGTTSKKPVLGKTGNAQIDRAGHTSNGRLGSNPNMQANRGSVTQQTLK